MNFVKKNTAFCLERWAHWIMSDFDAPNGYASRNILSKIRSNGTLSCFHSDDALEFEVDKVMGELKKRDAQVWTALIAYYSYKGTLARVTRSCRCTRARADKMVTAGTAWADAALVDVAHNM